MKNILLYRMRGISMLFILLFSGRQVFSQHDTIIANTILQQAESLNSKNTFNEQLIEINKASKIFAKNKKWEKILKCQKSLLYLALKYKNFTEVKKHVEQNHKYIPKEYKTYSAKSNNYLAFIEDQLGNVFISKALYEKIIPTFIQAKDTLNCKKIFNNLGIIEIKLRNYKNAIRYLQKAILMADKKDNKSLGTSQYNLALAYLYSYDSKNARIYLEIANKNKKREEGEIEMYYSKSYLHENNFPSALRYGEIALNKSKINGSKRYLYYRNLGEIYFELENYNFALKYFNEALLVSNTIEDKREVVKIMLPLAHTYLKLKKYNNSIEMLNNVNKYLDPKNKIINNGNINKKFLFDNGDFYMIELYSLKGLALYHKYLSTNDNKFLLESDANYNHATNLIEIFRNSQIDYTAKQDLTSETKSIFEYAITVKETLYNIEKKSKLIDEAFILVQKFNAFSLKEQISETTIMQELKIPQKLINKYFDLKINYQNSVYKVNELFTEDTQSEFELHKSVFIMYRDSLYKIYPKLGKMNVNMAAIPTNEIKKQLNENTVFISYFVGFEKIYSFSIDNYKVKFISKNINEKFIKTFSAHLKHLTQYQIYKQNIDSINLEFINNSYYLFQTLMKEQLNDFSNNNRLIIVPDGILYRLPFETLVTNKSASVTDASSYLLSKYNVSYLYYCQQLLNKNKNIVNDEFIGFGLEYDKYTLESMKELKKDSVPDWIIDKFRSEDLSHLYFADDEVIDIAKLLSGKFIINENATKSYFLNRANKSGIIHISAHSFVDFFDPLKSVIVFNKSNKEVDNLLNYNNIIASEFNCQLVTLSACNSSIGKVYEGEGVSSLTKAFTQAGSQSVIGSYWSVPDEISKLFMTVFYKKLKSGLDKDVALRETKLEFIKNKDLINPYYQSPAFWAAFNLYGSSDPLILDDTNYWLIYFIFAIILIGFFLLLQIVKYKSK